VNVYKYSTKQIKN